MEIVVVEKEFSLKEPWQELSQGRRTKKKKVFFPLEHKARIQ